MSEMTPERFAQIRAIYLAAERLPTAERDRYLETACGDDVVLANEVRALLAIDEPDEEAIEDAIVGVAKKLARSYDAEARPDTVGPYRIVDTLGRGGMGRVFLAERADGHFEQKVAVKLVDRSRLTPELVTRFRSERQILASLDHPNIGRLYDGGETGDGLPYLVMEYVDGVPVDQYCDEQALTIAERLALFRQICSAVEYAHRNLVVHRDIKPSNILVGGDGTPKLLDFGIAKLLSRNSIDYTVAATVGDMRLMTPRNASPEQVRGEAVTTATDIYALGLLLYELLSGRFPYDTTKAVYDLEQQICKSAPTRPSAAVTQLSSDTAMTAAREISQARRLPNADQLRKELKGDLDNIVLVSMRKEPERRYATVGQLSEDVQNYLEHWPVRARGESFGYRSAKFLRRNPGGVALTALSALIVTVLVASYTWRLGIERDRAELEAAKAREVAGFMTSLFKEADPRQRGSEPVTVVDMLNRGSERVTSDLTQQPELQASLIATIGESYHNMWDLARAREYLEGALPGLETELGADHSDVLKIRYILGMSTSFLGDYKEGLALHLHNYETLVQRFGRSSTEAATELHQIAFIQSSLRNHEDAERNFLEVIEIFRSQGDAGRQGLSTGLMEYGTLLSRVGRLDEELVAQQESLDIRRELHGRRHPDYVGVLNNVANNYYERREYDRAEELMRENMDLNREIYGDTSIGYGVAVANFAALLNSKSRYEDAAEYHQISLPIYRARYGEDHPRYAYQLENVGGNIQDLGDFASAEAYFRRAMDILASKFGVDHLEVAITRSRLGGLMIELDRYEEAVAELERTVATMSSDQGEVHNGTTTARQRLGKAYFALGRIDEALACVQVGIDALASPPDYLRGNLASLLDDKASMMAQTGETEAALAAIQEGIAVWRSMGVLDFPRYVFLDSTYAEVLAASGEPEMAIAYLEERERFYTDEFGADFAHMDVLHDELSRLGIAR